MRHFAMNASAALPLDLVTFPLQDPSLILDLDTSIQSNVVLFPPFQELESIICNFSLAILDKAFLGAEELQVEIWLGTLNDCITWPPK